MDHQSLINDDTCKYIIENTIKECNRVLANWKENDKTIGYDDKISLFRSYLAKFFKMKFGYGAYNRYIRIYYPLVTINNYRVVNIDFNINLSSSNANAYLHALDKYMQKMDVSKFSELHDLRPVTYVDEERPPVSLSSLIDYQTLNNIKFK